MDRPENQDYHQLESHQKALYEAIQKKNENLAAMYLGAIYVLNDNRNPDRIALAAHGFRELMEKMPLYVDSPIQKTGSSLSNKVRELEKPWKNACKNHILLSSSNDKIDASLRNFLKKFDRFFIDFLESAPSRKKKIGKMLGDFDPMKRSLPSPISELKIEMFDMIWNFFISVSHHQKNNIDYDEFKKWQNVMESFVLDIVKPRTFEDRINIDEIIAEGENK